MPNPLRALPSVSELLASPQLRTWMERVNQTTVVAVARRVLDEVRQQVRHATAEVSLPSPGELVERISQWVGREERERLLPLVNATGRLLADEFGRAPLSEEALAAMQRIASGYCSLDWDVETGEACRRQAGVVRLLRDLTGAAAANVVNNHGAALQLALTHGAAAGEVLIARGDVYEFGADYRVADTLRAAGCTVREVGSVNHTTVQDFEAAIGTATRAMLRVDRGQGVGPGVAPAMNDLVKLGRSRKVPVIASLSLASLVDLADLGIQSKGTLSDWVATGADLIVASADKLIGGPTAGILLGKAEFLEPLESHAWFRSVRVNRLTLAALEATLRTYRDPSLALHRIPILALLDTPSENLKLRATQLAERLKGTRWFEQVEVCEGTAHLGIWGEEDQAVASWHVIARPFNETALTWQKRLRRSTRPILACERQGALRFDLRSCQPGDDVAIAQWFEDREAEARHQRIEEAGEEGAIGSSTLEEVMRARQEDGEAASS